MTRPASQRGAAIVTGGARGIGRASALALAQAGFSIMLVDILEDEARTTAREIRDAGQKVSVAIADVADHRRAHEAVDQTLRELGPIDFLLNNAGRPMPKGILEIEEEEFDRTIAINLKSCFNYIRAVAPAMLDRGRGRIVCMSSLNAYSGGVTAAVSRFAYAAAKGGIVSMVRSLAKELGPAISINAIAPGLIATEGGGNPVIRARGSEIAANGIALRRVGKPADVAAVVHFLATSEPNFMTGQTLTVDGFQYQM